MVPMLREITISKSNGLIEHRIITGDAKPIRKAPHQEPFLLRKKWNIRFRKC
jgi:hypothetical protein